MSEAHTHTHTNKKVLLIHLSFSLNSINNVELKSETKVAKDTRDGLYDTKVIAKYPKNALKSETIINCQLTMLGTSYSRKQETVYYGKA